MKAQEINKCNIYTLRKTDSNTKSYLLLLVSLTPTMIKTN